MTASPPQTEGFADLPNRGILRAWGGKLARRRWMNPRTRLLAASLLGCMALASCEHSKPISDERRVNRSEDVANVYVAAYPAIPWAAVADKLEPKHELTTADAR